ncbi:Auxin transporter-like protein 3, partial [Mucuna pruriens]
MWRPQKLKLNISDGNTICVVPNFANLSHSNALSPLSRTRFIDTAIILMHIHQVITFGFACTPLYFVGEKFIGVHETKSLIKKGLG